MKRAMLWQARGKTVKCNLCARRCVIRDGNRGFCGVRENRGGKLYTLVYGKLIAVNVDPIEKKPLFHFYPGFRTFSIASVGCNFRCVFCCNGSISHGYSAIAGDEFAPEDVVGRARRLGCKIISYTYTEPTVNFEFVYETARLAYKTGIKNTWVTNGYATEDAIKKISKFLDAMTVDFKASGNSGFYKKYMGVPSVDPIYDLLEYAVKQRIFVEVTNLIIPQLGDDVERCRDLAQWINDALGAEVPFHIIQFFPAHRMTDLPPTPVETLEECALAAKEAGLRYVYVGNVPGHPSESTYCHNCGELLIQREGFRVLRMNLLNQRRCPTCGFKLNILI